MLSSVKLNKQKRPLGVTIWGGWLIIWGGYTLFKDFPYLRMIGGLFWLYLAFLALLPLVGIGILYACKTAHVLSIGLLIAAFIYALVISFLPSGGFAETFHVLILAAGALFYLTRPGVKAYFWGQA